MQYTTYTYCKFLVFYSFLLYCSSIMTASETIFNSGSIQLHKNDATDFKGLDQTCEIMLCQPWTGPVPVHCKTLLWLNPIFFCICESSSTSMRQKQSFSSFALHVLLPKNPQTTKNPKLLNSLYLCYFSCCYYHILEEKSFKLLKKPSFYFSVKTWNKILKKIPWVVWEYPPPIFLLRGKKYVIVVNVLCSLFYPLKKGLKLT